MNITAELITSILTQAGEAITLKNLRIENASECESDSIIRFEDNTDTTISIYYTPEIDLIAIGTINSLGSYSLHTRIRRASILDPDTFSAFITLEIMTLEMRHEIDNMV